MMTNMSNINGWKPIVLMVLQQVIFSGMNILLKLAAHDGMDSRVLVASRFIFGAVFMVPFAFFLERKTRPKLTWKVLFFAFLSGLFGGALGQNFFLESLALTSATFASAMLNLVPAVTFLVAVCLRLENLGWHTRAGKAKVFGTLLGLVGAMLFSFYKGPDFTIWKTNINLLNITSHHHQSSKSNDDNDQVLGIILGLLSCVSYSLWLIFQAKAAQHYPCLLSFTALMVLMASILSFFGGILIQHDWDQWKLGWNIRLLTVAYSGIIGTTTMFTIINLCVAMRGPVFVSAFNPLLLILVAIAGSLVLEEHLHLGSLLGGALIICGLYVVLWGKSSEIRKINQLVPEDNSRIEDQQKDKSQETNVNQIV